MEKHFNIPYILNGVFFEILTQVGDSVTVRCRHCSTGNVYKGSVRSTGNFHMHIKRKHPELVNKVQELKLTSYFRRRSLSRRSYTKVITGINNKVADDVLPTTRTIIHNPNVFTKAAIYQDNSNSNLNVNKVEDDPHAIIGSEGSEVPWRHMPVQIKEEQVTNEKDISSNSSKDSSSFECDVCVTENNQHVSNVEGNQSQIGQLLLKLENNLKGIQHELQIRNQIETNRLFLELAKFKCQNPQFNF